MLQQILILCAGSATRFGGDVPKQLVEIGGTPLLERTCAQLTLRGLTPTIVANAPLLPGFPHFAPSSHGRLVDTIISTTPAWQPDARIVFLLGDVFWYHASLDTVLSDDAPLRFYGQFSELFAFAFTLDQREFIEPKLAAVAAANRNGMLWEVYRSCCGFRLEDNAFDKQLYCCLTSNWTQDFDFPDQPGIFNTHLTSCTDAERADALVL